MGELSPANPIEIKVENWGPIYDQSGSRKKEVFETYPCSDEEVGLTESGQSSFYPI